MSGRVLKGGAGRYGICLDGVRVLAPCLGLGQVRLDEVRLGWKNGSCFEFQVRSDTLTKDQGLVSEV